LINLVSTLFPHDFFIIYRSCLKFIISKREDYLPKPVHSLDIFSYCKKNSKIVRIDFFNLIVSQLIVTPNFNLTKEREN